MASQKDRLLEWLESGKTITRLESFQHLGIVELSARIIDLEHGGHTVSRQRIKVTNRFGEDVSVTRYWIERQPGV